MRADLNWGRDEQRPRRTKTQMAGTGPAYDGRVVLSKHNTLYGHTTLRPRGRVDHAREHGMPTQA